MPSAPTGKKNGRPAVSCAECRRSKLKCSKTWPCTECVRRGCANICPKGTVTVRPTFRQLIEENDALRRRLSTRGDDSSASPPPHAGHSSSASPQQSHRRGSSPYASHSRPHPSSTISPNHPHYRTHLSASSPYLPIPPNAPPSMHPLLNPPPVGQLSLESGGRSRFYGPTAAAHLLPDEDDGDRGASGSQMLPAFDDQANPPPLAGTTSSGYHLPPSSSALPPHPPPPSTFPLLPASPDILALARSALPPAEVMQARLASYWYASSWRFEPISRDDFDRLLLDVLGGHDDAQPSKQKKLAAKLGVVLGVLAIGSLFDRDLEPHNQEARRFNELSIGCLSAAEFLANTSIASLQCLHLHCIYLLNDNRPRTDEIYAISGLALRLAILAGFHRDGTWWDLAPREANARRRVWWGLLALERINSNRLGCPPFILISQFDTLRPSDQPADSFLSWRWAWDDVMYNMYDQLDAIRSSPNLDGLEELDTSARAFWRRMPERLHPTEAGEDATTLRLQEIRLALHFYTGMLQIHRIGMSRALKVGGVEEEPLDSQYGESVRVVVDEACKHILELAEELFRIDLIHTRHTIIPLYLFSVLVPLAALVIRCPRSLIVNTAHHQLLRGVELLETAARATPCRWYAVLLQRAQKLASRATVRLATRWVPHPSGNGLGGGDEEVEAMLGNVTRLHAQQASAVPSPARAAPGDGPGALGADFDFDRWLTALTMPDGGGNGALLGESGGSETVNPGAVQPFQHQGHETMNGFLFDTSFPGIHFPSEMA